MRLYIFDLDGTLANIDHRLPLITGRKQWDAFFEACEQDQPIAWTIDLLNACAGVGRAIILSGRSEQVRSKTEAWLTRYGAFPDELLMRPATDYRPDEALKLEMLRDYLARHPGYTVQFIVEDRQRVVDMWRREGFNVLQCQAWEEAP